MDYMFFAINSICFGAIVLLLFWRMSHNNGDLLLRHWIIAVLSGIVFYILNQNIFSRIAILYFFINIAVPVIMLFVLFTLLWTHKQSE